MITTLKALEIARAALMVGMGGDWTGDLVIQPMADAGYVVRAVVAVPEAGQSEETIRRFEALVSLEGTLSMDVPELAPMAAPVWQSSQATIGALAALETTLKARPNIIYDEAGVISVYLKTDRYKVTFSQKLEPGERGDDLAYGALLDPRSGKIIGEMVPQ